MNKLFVVLAVIVCCSAGLKAQTKEAFTSTDTKNSETSLLDPSRFTVHHAMSFGMGTSSGSDLKTQSLYSTMIQYRFAAPVTINLNFGLPIYSNFSPKSNLTATNLQSADYFKNMPYDVSLTWKPQTNMTLQLSVVKRNYNDVYSPFYGPYPDLFGEQQHRSLLSGK